LTILFLRRLHRFQDVLRGADDWYQKEINPLPFSSEKQDPL
jgi:hypothetical protein